MSHSSGLLVIQYPLVVLLKNLNGVPENQYKNYKIDIDISKHRPKEVFWIEYILIII